jgi:hypothetical protein
MIDGDDLELFDRSLRHATQSHTGAALDAALEELGWHDALSVDARAAVSWLFELQGAANVVSSALDQVLAHALGLERHDAPAVVLPTPGRWSAPGVWDGRWLDVHGLGTARLGGPDGGVGTTSLSGPDGLGTTLVVARAGESHVAVEVETASLTRRTVAGIDPSLGLVEVTGKLAAARELGPVDWGAAVALGQLALGHELVGASRRMLELAREHALERVQFGRPIAMFQAVRHRLAEALLAIETADAALDAAWVDRCGFRPGAPANGPGSVSAHGPQAAAMAKATAGRGARVAARHCQQVLAGIGFTTEHPFHRHVRRALVLEQLLGATRSLTRELGHDILEHRRLPALLPL